MNNRNKLDPFVTKEILDVMAETFLNGTHPSDPDASPLFADVRNLSSTFILIGENEVMLSSVVNLVRYLAENRVMDNLEVWPGLFHLWPQYGRNLKKSNQAIRNIEGISSSGEPKKVRTIVSGPKGNSHLTA
jgi:acetyl esterase/lipase